MITFVLIAFAYGTEFAEEQNILDKDKKSNVLMQERLFNYVVLLFVFFIMVREII